MEAAGRFRGRLAIQARYKLFRLERQGALLAPNTLFWYDRMVLPFLAWLGEQGVRSLDDLEVRLVRSYRAGLASRPGGHGRPMAPKTLLESHRRSCASGAGRAGRATGSTSASSTWSRRGCGADGTVSRVPTDEQRWSTPEMLAVEQRLVASAMERIEAGVAVFSTSVLNDTLQATLERPPPGRERPQFRSTTAARGSLIAGRRFAALLSRRAIRGRCSTVVRCWS